MSPVPSPYRQLNDPDWLRTEYLGRGRTAADIGSEIGCPDKTVYRSLYRHGIRRPPHRTLASVPEVWLRDQYQHRGRSITDLADELELSRTSVRRALVEAGIPIDDLRLPVELDDIEWLSAQDGATNVELARRLGVTAEAVSRARQRHGLRVGVRRESRYPQLDDREWLHKRYVEQGMTQAELAAAIGCSRSAVALAMDRLGVPARPNKVPEHPELHDPEWLAGQVAAGGTPREIAERLGCHRTTVAAALRAHGIRVPDAGT